MTIERSPGYDQLVGRSSAEFHARAIVDPDYVYLVGLRDDGTIGGFGILRGITDIMGNLTLKRIAVATPGEGFEKGCCRRSSAGSSKTPRHIDSGSTTSSPMIARPTAFKGKA